MDETTNGGNVVDVEGAGESKLSSRLTMSSGIKSISFMWDGAEE